MHHEQQHVLVHDVVGDGARAELGDVELERPELAAAARARGEQPHADRLSPARLHFSPLELHKWCVEAGDPDSRTNRSLRGPVDKVRPLAARPAMPCALSAACESIALAAPLFIALPVCFGMNDGMLVRPHEQFQIALSPAHPTSKD